MSNAQTGARRAAQSLQPTRAQRTVARRAAESRATVPDLELGAEIEVDSALKLIDERRCCMTAVLVRACALALHEHPKANAAYRDGQFELYERVNVGLLVADEDDLVVATIFDADGKSLPELTAEIEDLRQRASALRQPERSGATFTLVHREAPGVHWQVPLIGSGQAAALAAGETREVPVVRDHDVVPGHAMSLTLACDHRILYGAEAARFLARIEELVEQGPL